MTHPRRLDHLVYAVSDLDAAAARFTDLTGVTPVVGGVHEGFGTANRLLALRHRDEDEPAGRTAYLELIGPDPGQPDVPAERTMFGIGRLGDDFAPRLHTWAVRPDDLDDTVRAAEEAGVDVGAVHDGSRRTPAGDLLSWRLTRRTPLPMAGLQPFLIDWRDTPLPATDPALPALTLTHLSVRYADPDRLRHVLEVLGVDDVAVEGDHEAGLVVGLATPRGPVELA